MRQYVIDQLRESDYVAIKEFLDSRAGIGAMDGIYWVDLPPTLYSPTQKEHTSCQPFAFAVNLHRNSVSFELLVRSRTVLRCACIGYATPNQRDYIIAFADEMIEQLHLRL